MWPYRERKLCGKPLGEKLVSDILKRAKKHGFRILQFNAVVSSNTVAHNLYKKLKFTPLGTVPGGFLNKDGVYEDICLYFKEL